MTEEPPVLNLVNVLVLLGILVTTVGLVYFAGTFVARLSEWGKLVSLTLLAVSFIALGAHFEQASRHERLVDVKGFRWLRVSTALFLLGGIAGFVTVTFFTSMTQVDARVKILVTILIGLALIGVAGWMQKRRAGDAGAPPVRDA